VGSGLIGIEALMGIGIDGIDIDGTGIGKYWYWY
jgi:hypothetical protein